MLANSIANIAISDLSHSFQTSSVQLPFIETDTSAASKQEHVISVVINSNNKPKHYENDVPTNDLPNHSYHSVLF